MKTKSQILKRLSVAKLKLFELENYISIHPASWNKIYITDYHLPDSFNRTYQDMINIYTHEIRILTWTLNQLYDDIFKPELNYFMNLNK